MQPRAVFARDCDSAAEFNGGPSVQSPRWPTSAVSELASRAVTAISSRSVKVYIDARLQQGLDAKILRTLEERVGLLEKRPSEK
jgi:hypothetical protein